MYFDSTMLLLIPGLLLALFAQGRVKATYAKYARVPISTRMTGAEAAQRMLQDSGNDAVRVQPVQGQLTDHYDPKKETLNLSEGVYDSSSVSAVCRTWASSLFRVARKMCLVFRRSGRVSWSRIRL